MKNTKIVFKNKSVPSVRKELENLLNPQTLLPIAWDVHLAECGTGSKETRMNIESLIKSTPATHEKMVAVRLPIDIVRKMQAVRKETGKSNTEIYAAFLRDGLDKYAALSRKGSAPQKKVEKKAHTGGSGTQPKKKVVKKAHVKGSGTQPKKVSK